MKREEISKIFPDATKEQLDAVMALNGAAIEAEKEKRKPLEVEIADKKAAFEKLQGEFSDLQKANAGAADYKAKFEQLQKDVADKEAKAKAEAEAAAKAERVSSRFAAALGDKKFSHDAIKADYLKRFGEALADEKNAGKSDADIFHELTKDDAAAFVGVQTLHLEGGANKAAVGKTYSSKDEIMAIKDRGERRAAIAANMNLFEKGND